MCGFAGLYTAPDRGLNTARLAAAMGDRIAHRGPDDTGEWTGAEGGLSFAFRRLSIVDLTAAGHQPMRSASRRFTMVFNGEVYNSAELGRELAALGYSFRGHSDTEVILAAFEEWGVEPALGRFIGMFAIAAWDERERALHLIRDRLGIKPLYVLRGPGVIAFASELKCFQELPFFRGEVDDAALASYLRFFYVPSPRAIFRDTSKVPAGTVLTVRDPAAPLPEPRAYWALPDVYRSGHDGAAFRGGAEEALEALDALLHSSVSLRTAHADVPVGAFLSGGIDSTVVTSVMTRVAAGRVNTYTVGYAEREYDESAVARSISDHLGTAHHAVGIGPAEVRELVPRLPVIFDEPFADVSQVPACLVSQLARRDVTVVLSGDGGDELFGGYNRYAWGQRLWNRLSPVPRFLRAGGGRLMRRLSPEVWDRLAAPVTARLSASDARLFGEKVHKVADVMASRSPAEMYGRLVAAWPAERLTDAAVAEPDVFDELLEAELGGRLVDRFMLADLATYLPDNNLMKVDRASMAVGLEARVPILDHRIVEFALSLPSSLKIRDGVSKWILRQLAYRYVPQKLLDGPKKGFDAPIGDWLRGELRDWSGDLLHGRETFSERYVRPEALRRTWEEHQAGVANHGLRLWAVLMLEAWAQEWCPSA